MPSTVLTSKGQVTVPIEIRREMGLKSGDRLEFTHHPETGTYQITRKMSSIRDLYGIAKHNGAPAAIEDINDAVGDVAVERYLRSKADD